MKAVKIFISFLLIFLYSTKVYCQVDNDKLTISKHWTSYKLYKGFDQYSNGEILEMMDENSEAYITLRKATNANIGSAILGGIGGGIIGYQIGFASKPNVEINRTSLLLGASFIVGSIPLSRMAKKNTEKAVELYNEALSNKSRLNEIETSFLISPHGVGLRVTF